jgi:hypothetical protein
VIFKAHNLQIPKWGIFSGTPCRLCMPRNFCKPRSCCYGTQRILFEIETIPKEEEGRNYTLGMFNSIKAFMASEPIRAYKIS